MQDEILNLIQPKKTWVFQLIDNVIPFFISKYKVKYYEIWETFTADR